MVPSFDGQELAVHSTGEGRPVLMLHGLFSSADMNWVRYGHAAQLVEAGFECIMPDLRAHGASAKPHDAADYPEDVLARDTIAIAEALQLEDFDLVGFSLGARTAVRAVMLGLEPGKLVLSGMGLQGLAGWAGRSDFFIDAIDRFDSIERGDPAYFATQFMKTMKIDRVAARHLLQAVSDTSPEGLAKIAMPTAVICGDEDRDNGSPTDLVEALPHAVHVEIPGTHMSCVTKRELGAAIAVFLKADT
ncbi:alpha/beta fold hydrolase [Altererythrobacter sp. ZODW24]|uniref:alpha/beta fold hydrolase n=1 Tax=Altererythrobacter sp. ZODW24 TaxID=2185142 RepID=UPI000DF7FEAC|nr:alpha/beta fold hydrolase [Altererythrobacter sp. ZODW24]